MLYLPLHCGSVLHHPVPGMLLPPRNAFPIAYKKFGKSTIQTVSPCQGQQQLPDLFTIILGLQIFMLSGLG